MRWERRASSGSSSGLSPLRGPRDRRLGPLGRAVAVSLQELRAHVQRADQNADGASAQEGEVARPRPAMIEGKSLAKTAELCGVHPTTAFRWRHRFLRAPADDKPRTLSGIVEADETFILESFKGRWSDLPRKARKRGGTARHPGPYQDNIPVLVARDRKGATFDAVLPQDDGASIAAALTGVVTPQIISSAMAASRWPPSPAGPAFPSTPCPRRESRPRGAASAHQQRQRLPQPPQAMARRFNGVATKNLPSYLGWRRALEAWGQQRRSAKMDRRRNRKRTIPTDNAIRARPDILESRYNSKCSVKHKQNIATISFFTHKMWLNQWITGLRT